MKHILLFAFILSFNAFSNADTNFSKAKVKDLCESAHGKFTGIDVTKPVPNHNDGKLMHGPIACLCGKVQFTPRPGDDCVQDRIVTSDENFCIQAQGQFIASRGRDNNGPATLAPKCYCGSEILKDNQCCTSGQVSKCALTHDSKTWPKVSASDQQVVPHAER